MLLLMYHCCYYCSSLIIFEHSIVIICIAALQVTMSVHNKSYTRYNAVMSRIVAINVTDVVDTGLQHAVVQTKVVNCNSA